MLWYGCLQRMVLFLLSPTSLWQIGKQRVATLWNCLEFLGASENQLCCLGSNLRQDSRSTQKEGLEDS